MPSSGRPCWQYVAVYGCVRTLVVVVVAVTVAVRDDRRPSASLAASLSPLTLDFDRLYRHPSPRLGQSKREGDGSADRPQHRSGDDLHTVCIGCPSLLHIRRLRYWVTKGPRPVGGICSMSAAVRRCVPAKGPIRTALPSLTGVRGVASAWGTDDDAGEVAIRPARWSRLWPLGFCGWRGR
jgi:hypothetical protein